ncbi:hypothetical protein HYW40_00650 [Candidatus Curtissbacteria bacterium]|nr:hypothetical protein [Candidatus Curtissbacteria bacterium]
MLFVILTGILLDFFAAPVYAQSSQPAKIGDVVGVLQNIISLLAPAAAIAFFVMLLFGGYKFITSGGDPKAVGSARATLTYAIIGIILVVAAWLILQLIKTLTGADVTTVAIPTN